MARKRFSLSLPAALVAGMILLMVAAQIMYKFAGLYAVSHADTIASYLFNPWLWLGLVCALLGMILWLIALRHLPLATAYPWTALIYVFTPTASAFVFGEQLRIQYIIGLALISAGVLVTTRGVASR